MRALGKTYSDQEIRTMITKADKHRKGKVDFQDFLALLENVSLTSGSGEGRKNMCYALTVIDHFSNVQ